MPIVGDIRNLYSDKEKTRALFPTTKIDAVSDNNGVGLNAILENVVHVGSIVEDTATAPVNADTLGGRPAEEFATQNFVSNEIAKAQLSGDDSEIDLSGFATSDNLNAHTDNTNNPHNVTIEQIGAAPAGYGLGEEVKFVNNIDNLLVPGQYKFYNNGNPLINGVADTASCNVEVISSGAGCIHRISSHTSGYCAERRYNGTTWGEWIRCDSGVFAPAGYGYGEPAASIGRFATEQELNTAFSAIVNEIGDYESKQILFVDAITGEYSCSATVYRLTEVYAFVEVRIYATSGVYHKRLVDGTWQPIEWVNPPMKLGVIYRTTERWHDNPVYTALIYLGNMPDGQTYKNVEFPVSGGIPQPFFVTGMNSLGVALPAHYSDGNSQYLSAEPNDSQDCIRIRMKNGVAEWTAVALVKFILV